MAGAVSTFPTKVAAPRRATAESPLVKTFLVGILIVFFGLFSCSPCSWSFTKPFPRASRFS